MDIREVLGEYTRLTTYSVFRLLQIKTFPLVSIRKSELRVRFDFFFYLHYTLHFSHSFNSPYNLLYTQYIVYALRYLIDMLYLYQHL